MNVSVGDTVLPGDVADEIITAGEKMKIILGPGLIKDIEKIKITKAGVLRRRNPNTYWVDNHQKRYIPARNDNVIGTVVQKSGDIFKVDIGGSVSASLSYLAFEGATKRNRPDVQLGDVVYAKLLVASKDMEPELICIDSQGKKGHYGVLNGGFVFTCSLNLVKKILNPCCPLIDALKNEWPFELAAGMNGRIWINARTANETIALGNAILASEFQSEEEIRKICGNVANVLARGY